MSTYESFDGPLHVDTAMLKIAKAAEAFTKIVEALQTKGVTLRVAQESGKYMILVEIPQ